MAKKGNETTLKQLEDIRKIFSKDTSINKNKLGLSLVDEAIYMKQTLDKLKEKIDKNGVVTEMCQGSYTIERENPALKSYTSLIKNFNTTVKQVNDLLPTEEPKQEDPFDNFE